ncbi:MAG: hypothetical protein KIS92_00775 [Planctomycetota bacterium]|nr:hypothetical protein [Planctomycetota bacterium]
MALLGIGACLLAAVLKLALFFAPPDPTNLYFVDEFKAEVSRRFRRTSADFLDTCVPVETTHVIPLGDKAKPLDPEKWLKPLGEGHRFFKFYEPPPDCLAREQFDSFYLVIRNTRIPGRRVIQLALEIEAERAAEARAEAILLFKVMRPEWTVFPLAVESSLPAGYLGSHAEPDEASQSKRPPTP